VARSGVAAGAGHERCVGLVRHGRGLVAQQRLSWGAARVAGCRLWAATALVSLR
jgi:hypothetical protein